MSSIEKKVLSFSSSSIKCHSAAQAAYDQSRLCPLQFNADFDCSLLQLMQAQDPLMVVKAAGRGEYLFYSGWHWWSHCQTRGIEQGVVLIMPDMSDDDLEVSAWSYQLSNLLKAPSRHQVLASIARVLESMPKGLRSKLLGSYSRKSVVASVQSLSGESRSAIRHQMKSLFAVKPSNTSILDELLDT